MIVFGKFYDSSRSLIAVPKKPPHNRRLSPTMAFLLVGPDNKNVASYGHIKVAFGQAHLKNYFKLRLRSLWTSYLSYYKQNLMFK
jgi:hypothetical protein